jgi:hypothetical protein
MKSLVLMVNKGEGSWEETHAIGHKSLCKRYHGLWQENEIFPVVLNHVWRKDMMESWTHKPVYTKEKTIVMAAKWDWTVVVTGLTNFVTMTSKNFALTKEWLAGDAYTL